MKKLISLLVAVLLLATLCVPFTVSAADTVIDPEVLNSVTEEDETGLGLAFRYTMNMKDVTLQEGTKRTFSCAYVGENKVVKVGAIVTNVEATGTNPDAMVLENVNNAKVKNVEGKRLWDWDENSLSFAVRVTKIPADKNKDQIYARPYYVLEDNSVVYGAITNESYFSATPVVLPEIGTDIDVTKKKDRIRVSAATHAVNDEGVREVSLTFRNYTSNWITEEIDYVQYTCYDKNGTKIDATPNDATTTVGTIYIGCIDTKKNKVKTFTFEVPDETAEVRLTKSSITYWTEWA